jgi:pyruvate,water dikinase
MTECSRALAQLRAQDEEGYGGKSASLGELIAGGIPVPPGFAISTAAFDAFLAAQSLRERVEDVLAGLDADDVAAVARASAQVALLMRRTPVPDIVAAEVEHHYTALAAARTRPRRPSRASRRPTSGCAAPTGSARRSAAAGSRSTARKRSPTGRGGRRVAERRQWASRCS